jgi:hypothetical protein
MPSGLVRIHSIYNAIHKGDSFLRSVPARYVLGIRYRHANP